MVKYYVKVVSEGAQVKLAARLHWDDFLHAQKRDTFRYDIERFISLA